MHLLMITYQLQGISEADYLAQSKEDTAFLDFLATFPGFYSKVWLADAATNTYGGVYLWKDREAMEAFIHSDIIKAVAADILDVLVVVVRKVDRCHDESHYHVSGEGGGCPGGSFLVTSRSASTL